MTADLDRWRCPKCGHTLARVKLAPGSVIEVKCGCNTIATLQVAANGGTVTA